MTTMTANYTVQTRINKPVADVFAAIIDPDQLVRYFANRTSGPLTEGQRVTWHWEHCGDYPVTVTRIVDNQLIELQLDSTAWQKTSGAGYPVTVTLAMEPLDDGGTMLSISEAGWKTDADGLKASHENCGGWTHMAMCLKGWIEHGLDLR